MKRVQSQGSISMKDTESKGSEKHQPHFSLRETNCG